MDESLTSCRIASGVLFGIGGGIQEMCYAALQEIVPIKHRILAIGQSQICYDSLEQS
jgi:hypothetical protein